MNLSKIIGYNIRISIKPFGKTLEIGDTHLDVQILISYLKLILLPFQHWLYLFINHAFSARALSHW